MYATSRPIDYCIRFDPNADDATGTMEEQTLAYDTEADLFTCDFVRTGYVFAGWNTSRTAAGTPLQMALLSKISWIARAL